MKRLTILFALFIVCDLSFNTAFAQDVRQKPVVKKQTTTTTKQSASTKKTVISAPKIPTAKELGQFFISMDKRQWSAITKYGHYCPVKVD